MDHPEPVVFLAIEPQTKADRDNLRQGLQALMAEDPTFRADTDTRTGETIIRGMSESHLDGIVDRLKREFNVAAVVGRSRVAYKETLTRPAEGEGRYVLRTGSHGLYGHAKIRLWPSGRGSGYIFENHVAGGVIPNEFIKSIDEGIQDALTHGVLAGYPVDDVRIELYDGSFHEIDSSEMAFKMAGSMAFQDAARKADPVLLEPIMSLEVAVPEEYMGDVIGDINSRRGQIEGMELKGTTQIIRANVPLAKMFGYANDVRSRTEGLASSSMHFDRYELLRGDPDRDDDRNASVAVPRTPAPKGGGRSSADARVRSGGSC